MNGPSDGRIFTVYRIQMEMQIQILANGLSVGPQGAYLLLEAGVAFSEKEAVL